MKRVFIFCMFLVLGTYTAHAQYRSRSYDDSRNGHSRSSRYRSYDDRRESRYSFDDDRRESRYKYDDDRRRYSYRKRPVNYKGRSYLGIRAGGNHSLLVNNSSNVDLGLTPEFHGGLVLNIGLGGFLSFQPEFLYNRSSLKLYPTTGTPVTRIPTSTTLQSIDVPALFRFSFGNKTQFFINAGAAGRYALISETGNGFVTERNEFEESSFNERTTYGGMGGLGVAFNGKNGQLTLEARGYYPLGDFQNGAFSSDQNRQLDVMLSLGYLVKLGR